MSKATPAAGQASKKSGIKVEQIAKKGEAAQPAQNAQGQSRLSVSRCFPNWLAYVRACLAFTSYQTGQLFLVGLRNDKKVSFNQQNFVRAMGVSAQGNRLYVGGLAQIWRLENILERNERANEHFDRVYIPRAAVTIGDI